MERYCTVNIVKYLFLFMNDVNAKIFQRTSRFYVYLLNN